MTNKKNKIITILLANFISQTSFAYDQDLMRLFDLVIEKNKKVSKLELAKKRSYKQTAGAKNTQNTTALADGVKVASLSEEVFAKSEDKGLPEGIVNNLGLNKQESDLVAVEKKQVQGEQNIGSQNGSQNFAQADISSTNNEGDREIASVRNNVVAHPPEQDATALKSETLTGDWGGVRTKLFNSGYDFKMMYRGELSQNFSGGLQTGESALEELDLKLLLDGEKIFGHKGLTLFLFGLGTKGPDQAKKPSVNVGDAQGVSNIEAVTDDFELYEGWIQQTFFDEKVSLLFGLHDANTEFYVTDSSGLFFNSSFALGKEFSQTGVNGPSVFPNTAVALRLRVEPVKDTYLMTAVFNGQAGEPNAPKGTHLRMGGDDGVLLINEFGIGSSGDVPSKYALGYWSYTHAEQNGQGTPQALSSSGFYLLMDKSVSESLSFFLRYGVAGTLVAGVKDNLAGGVVYKGLIPSRESDKIGLGFTKVNPVNPDLKDETTFEVNYRIEAMGGLAVQPSIQHVMNPKMSNSTSDATYGAVRLELNF